MKKYAYLKYFNIFGNVNYMHALPVHKKRDTHGEQKGSGEYLLMAHWLS